MEHLKEQLEKVCVEKSTDCGIRIGMMKKGYFYTQFSNFIIFFDLYVGIATTEFQILDV